MILVYWPGRKNGEGFELLRIERFYPVFPFKHTEEYEDGELFIGAASVTVRTEGKVTCYPNHTYDRLILLKKD